MFIAITRTEVPVARNKYPEETVEKILDVAERLIVERGYEHTTMIGDKPVWQLSDRLGRNKLNKFVSDWNFAWVELQNTGDRDACQDWKGHYEG